MRVLAVCALLSCLVCSHFKAVHACSRAIYLGPEDIVITTRSMDWASDIGTNLWVLPVGMSRDGACGGQSAKWTSKYGSVIASAFDAATSDGMNEKGLVTSLLYLAESEYPKPGVGDDRPLVAVSVWAQYVLDNFATVAEAVTALKAEPFHVATGMTPDGHPATVHLAISDPTGDSAIFEYIDGKLVIHHGREFQVMTNSPTYDQQLALNSYWKQIGGTVMLPGTSRAADRFARASFYINAIPQTTDERHAIASAFGVIRNVSVPLGITTPGQPNISSTRWRSVSDHKNKRYYFESTLSPSVFWVNLGDLQLGQGGKVKKLAVSQGEIYSGNAAKDFVDAEPFKFMPADTEGPKMDVKLEGTWLLKLVEGQAVAKDMKTPSLTIAQDGKVSGFGGVNRLMGSMSAGGEKLFGPVATTMMAGPPEAMKTEMAFTRALEKVTVSRTTDGGLELLGADGTVLLEFVAE